MTNILVSVYKGVAVPIGESNMIGEPILEQTTESIQSICLLLFIEVYCVLYVSCM